MAIQAYRLPEQAADRQSVVDVLSAHHMFGALPRVVLSGIAGEAIERPYRKGHHLFYVGDPPSYVFILKSGLVAATVLDERGNERVVFTYGQGDVFGQVAAVLGVEHSRTVVAVVPTTAVLVPEHTFVQVYRRYPELADLVIRELSEALLRAQQTAVQSTLSPVVSRVAKFLLECGPDADDPRRGRAGRGVELSHQDLAFMLGTTRETVTRVLGRLARTRAIAVSKGRVLVLQPDALRQLVDS